MSAEPTGVAVYQQAQRWLAAGCFEALAEALAEDLRTMLRLAAGRSAQPSAASVDSRTLRSTPESGSRAGHEGAERKQGAKLHRAVDMLGHLLTLHLTPASTDDRREVGRLVQALQAASGQSVELAHADQGCTGQKAADAAKAHGIDLAVIELPEATAR